MFEMYISYVIICNWKLMHSETNWHALVYGWQIRQRVIIRQVGPMCWLNYYLTLLQRKIISKDLDSSQEPTQWSLRHSIVEAEIGILLWLQHQPCGEVDMILHPVDYELSNGMWIIKTNPIVAEIWIAQIFARRKEGTACAATLTNVT